MKIGIDIGGSHIGVGLVDSNGKLVCKKEIDIKKEDKLKIESFLIEEITKLIYEVLEEKKLKLEGVELIGIAAPGLIKNGVITKSKNLNLSNFPISEKLNKIFNIPILLRNDCKCSALAERKYGSLKGYSNCLFLTIGTGIGGTAFINGNLLETSTTTGFGMGHTIIQKNGKKCSCGNKGCFEAYASIGNLRKDVKKSLNINNHIGGEELIYLLKNEKSLIPIINEYIDNLSIGISNLINIFGPDVIVFGGSIVYYEDLFIEKLKENINKKKYLYNNEFFPKIIMGKYKNDAGIIGSTIEKF